MHSSLLAQKEGKRKRLKRFDFTPNFNQHSRSKPNRATIPVELFHFISSSQPKPRIANMVLLTKQKDRDTLNKQTSKDSISFSTPTFCLGLASTSSAEYFLMCSLRRSKAPLRFPLAPSYPEPQFPRSLVLTTGFVLWLHI